MRTHENEPFVLRRDVKAVMVPAGIDIELKSGQSGFITQALAAASRCTWKATCFASPAPTPTRSARK
jgi:hypothetical protein